VAFENKILAVVEDFIPGTAAEFDYGTLFVSGLDQNQATLLLDRIRGSVLCSVQMSKEIGLEIAYDFT